MTDESGTCIRLTAIDLVLARGRPTRGSIMQKRVKHGGALL